MELATHNTMTYRTPKQFWAKLIPFIARCQSVDYKKQHELGAKGFDLRVFWDKEGKLEFRHGIVSYNADDIDEILEYANENGIYVRVLLEVREYNAKHIKNLDEIKQKFIDFCSQIETKYPNIKFYGGNPVINGCKTIYEFKNKPNIKEVPLYSSITSLFNSNSKFLRIIDDLCPWIYARLKNKKNINTYKDSDCTLILDFINIQEKSL